ncbi:MAG TPA: endonuclease/exonuclease/phosphatase family protein [Gemmatimonadaceae bacterium]
MTTTPTTHRPLAHRLPARRAAALAGLAVLSALGACAGARPDEAPAPRGALRVLVYNIHAGKDAAGADNLARVAQLVRDRRVDVALLQEVDHGTRRSGGVNQPDELARRTGLNFAFGRTLDYQGGGYGIAVLSRFPVRGHTLVPLPIDPPQERAGGSREPRGALIATLETPSGPLHVLNTHLDASGSDTVRLQEAARVVALLDSLRRTGAATIAGGDFNALPSSAVIGLLAESGMRDGWLACGGAGDGHTFPAAAPVKRIDYLFLAPEAGCLAAEVVGAEVSDHRGVLLTIVP